MGRGAPHTAAAPAFAVGLTVPLKPAGRRWLLGVLFAAITALGAASTAAAAGLEAIPFPGTPDASPRTQIILPSRSRGEVLALSAVGSVSGAHPGRLIALPDHAGTAFVPLRPFLPGERVHVHVRLDSPLGALALGAPWSQTRFSFTVGEPVRAPAAARHGPRRGRATDAVQNGTPLHSIPGLRPPTVRVSGDPDLGSGDIFLTPRNTYQRHVDLQRGPMILNGEGKLVWFRPVPGGLAMNLAVQTYRDKPVLTWWQGAAGGKTSEDVIADSSYRTVAVLHAGDGDVIDAHDIQITPQNTALIDATTVVKANLRAVGGPAHGSVLDDVVQELDIKTGQVLWEWHSLGHVPLSASYARPVKGYPFDYFHLNSLQQLPDGQILISARHTWAIYAINKRNGAVAWSIGGKHSNFTLGPGAHFSWQHDARLTGDTLSLFDDASDGPRAEANESSAKILTLDWKTMRATLAQRFTHSPPLLAVSQGNAQRLTNGDMFVGWGSEPDFSEYSPRGQQIFAGSFVLGIGTYRAYRFPWTGSPATRPALAISPTSGSATLLYASWNGATAVNRWRVLAGPSPTSLQWLTRAPWTGLETEITVRTTQPYFEVQALDASGHILGSSPVRRY